MLAPVISVPTALNFAPKVAFDFTSAVLDSRISFSRALNTATRINSSGLIELVNADLPRFDHTLTTGGACRGLLIERGSVNRATHSQNPSAWFKSGTATVSGTAEASPDGADNAYAISGITGYANRFGSSGSLGITGGTTVTFSIFLKSNGNGNSVRLMLATAGGTYKQADALYTITENWARYSFTMTTNADNTEVFWIVYGAPGTTAVVPWGAQVEHGTTATSYIPTTTTTVTRNADAGLISGATFSSIWNTTQGGVLVRALPLLTTGVRPVVQFDDNTTDNIIAVRGNTTNPELYVKATTDQAQLDAGTIAANTAYRLAASWKSNSCTASANSGAPVFDGAATIPAVTQMRLGTDGTEYLDGYIQSVEYYDTYLGGASLQVVSSVAGYRSIIGPVIRGAIIS